MTESRRRKKSNNKKKSKTGIGAVRNITIKYLYKKDGELYKISAIDGRNEKT